MKSKYIIGIVIALIVIVGAYMIFASSNQQKISIAGSTSVQPVAEKLAEAYMKEHPNVKITVQGGGSAVGITSAKQGTAQIGTSSSALKPAEAEGLNQTQIAKDGIVIVVNNANNLTSLTSAQVKSIFAGNVTDWSQIGGSSGSISVITREDGSGTRDAFQKLIMGGNGTSIIKSAIVQSSTEAILQSVKGNPDAIGYMSLASVTSDVKGLTIDGVAPSEQTVSDGTYKVQRPFLFLTKGTPTGVVKDFIDWTMSSEGQAIVKQAGATPMTS
ncbi:phosphate ABC transporter substrate-binding protein [Methanobacterium paludis]|nr:phosphate ABC transporter substrate-binding protein [Methanobacterium paludis]